MLDDKKQALEAERGRHTRAIEKIDGELKKINKRLSDKKPKKASSEDKTD